MKRFMKRIKKANLRNVDVELVSLLFDEMTPANQKGAVVKSEHGSHKHVASVTKFKSDKQGRLYVTLMEPGVVDSQGDSYEPGEIQKAADHFAMKGLVGRNDVNHNLKPVTDFAVVESYILKAADKEHFPDTKIGSWVQVIKCLDMDSELWAKVLKGQFNGVSIYGAAEGVPNSNEAVLAELQGLLADLRKAAGKEVPADGAEKNADGADEKKDSGAVIAAIEKRIKELEPKAPDAGVALAAIKNELEELGVALKKAVSQTLKKSEGDAPRKVVIDGTEVVLKPEKMELYKGIANVDAGSSMNILQSNQTGLFIDEVVGGHADDTLNEISVIPLLKDHKIDLGLVQDIGLRNQDTIGSGAGQSAMSPHAIGTYELTCPVEILHAELTLKRDTVEFYKDKYGEAAFGAYVEQHIAKKVNKAIRKLLFMGDKTNGSGGAKAMDGIIAIAAAASAGSLVEDIDAEAHPLISDRFEPALLEFSDDMLEEQENFRFYISHRDMIRLRAEISDRETNLGDKFLMEAGNVSYQGIPVKPRYLPDNHIVAGLPKFIIVGYRTDAEMKVEHHGSDWNYHWYIRLRAGVTYMDGFAKIFEAK